jgi:hypothetical protein
LQGYDWPFAADGGHGTQGAIWVQACISSMYGHVKAYKRVRDMQTPAACGMLVPFSCCVAVCGPYLGLVTFCGLVSAVACAWMFPFIKWLAAKDHLNVFVAICPVRWDGRTVPSDCAAVSHLLPLCFRKHPRTGTVRHGPNCSTILVPGAIRNEALLQ